MARCSISAASSKGSPADLTRIHSIDVMTAQTVISEIGLDMSRWKTEVRLASWLGLCPNPQISGGKVLNKGTRRVVNRAATALRMAASTLSEARATLKSRPPREQFLESFPIPRFEELRADI